MSEKELPQNQPQDHNPNHIDRKGFFDFFLKPAREVLASEPTPVEKEAKATFERSFDAFIEKSQEIKKGRRWFLKVFLGVPIASLIADQLITKGKFLYYGIQFATNTEFREKFAESIKTGEIKEDIESLFRDLKGKVPSNFEMGEKLDSTESWLADSFANHEIRVIRDTETGEGRPLLIADIDRVEVIEAVTDNISERRHVTNFTKTAEQSGPFATLPTNQQEVEDASNNYVPRLYSAYQVNGEIIEFLDVETQNFNPRGGGLVIINGQPRVVDASQLNEYQVGKNCEAVEVIAFVIRSTHLEQDLKDMEKSGSLAAIDMINDPRYNSFLATFYDSSQQAHTVLISTYFPPEGNNSVVKWEQADRLTVARALDLFEQIREERGFVSFDMQVPDPDFSMVTSSYSVVQPLEGQISVASSPSSLGQRYGWNYHPMLDGQGNFGRVNSRKYFIASKK